MTVCDIAWLVTCGAFTLACIGFFIWVLNEIITGGITKEG